MKVFLKKLEYHFWIESTQTENATFLHKTILSEANVGTKIIGSTKWTYQKKKEVLLVTASFFFFFWKFCFSLEPLTKSFFDVWTTQMSVFILFVSAGVLFEGAFSYNHSIGNNCPEFHYRFLHSYFLETEQSVLKTIMTH